MKNHPFRSMLLASGLLCAVSSCEFIEKYLPPDGHMPQKPDFSRYVAVGNSLTAGFASGGLYREGQLVAYPNLIAGQLEDAGGGTFTQPLFSEAEKNGSGYLQLNGFDAQGNPVIVPVETQLAIRCIGKDDSTPLLSKYTGLVNNLGVPGIRLSNILTPGYGLDNPQGFNPYYERLLPEGQGLKTYLQFVAESKPTFFTCWIGNNDVILYSTSGGTTPLTPGQEFEQNLKTLLFTLTVNGAKGVVANIPSATDLPFLTTITVANVRQAAGGAPLWIKTGTGNVRLATDNDLINLDADSIGIANALQIPKGFSEYYPLNNEDVLDTNEVVVADSATAAYNKIIHQLTNEKHLAFLDANAFLKGIRAGKTYDGVPVNSDYITGGMFSLDGVHLTPKGNAIAANEFIRIMNQHYKTTIAPMNTAAYVGVL